MEVLYFAAVLNWRATHKSRLKFKRSIYPNTLHQIFVGAWNGLSALGTWSVEARRLDGSDPIALTLHKCPWLMRPAERAIAQTDGTRPMSAQELAQLATQHGSDKWNGHWYAGPYAAHLESLRQQPISLLEIGIGGYSEPEAGGASLRMWRDYFPHAQIAGLDYYDKSPHAGERTRVYQGSQADPVAIARMLGDFPEGFDVIIDDGSHQNEHVIASLYMLWQYVKPEGWYIIEDLQTSYWPNHGGRISDLNSPQTSMGVLKSLVDALNWEERHQPTYLPSSFDTSLTGLHFYHNLAFLKKGNNREGSTEVKANRIPGI